MRSRKLISLILTTTLITFMTACSETTSNTSEVATVVPTKRVPVVMELPTMIPVQPTSTAEPTATPTAEPTSTSTVQPISTPTEEPTATTTNTPLPTPTPTPEPTATPTPEPVSDLQPIKCSDIERQFIKYNSSIPFDDREVDLDFIMLDKTGNYPLEIFWKDYQGKEVRYGSVRPGSSFNIVTYIGNMWVLRKTNGDCVAGFVAEKNDVSQNPEGLSAIINNLSTLEKSFQATMTPVPTATPRPTFTPIAYEYSPSVKAWGDNCKSDPHFGTVAISAKEYIANLSDKSWQVHDNETYSFRQGEKVARNGPHTTWYFEIYNTFFLGGSCSVINGWDKETTPKIKNPDTGRGFLLVI